MDNFPCAGGGEAGGSAAILVGSQNSGRQMHDLLKQLEAAKQRELELMAVIDAMIEVLVIVDDEYCYSNDDRVTDVLRMAEDRRKR